ncbi:lytic transglycosylase domain-containing protein [Methylobacterium sp. J-076]|uniref:lytic transglycosylase domain-containing protein n=1 Tax=Methylobacterium sp. J-076 TaxID=2836655 RepID=UPI001FB9D063|nr:transglycosylase SLT domain-containing protein [Methylobacterium sp. J-076]MCJ2011182.1 transglycosylase SLT domain-containing protein [Methylobacterium sp. J-076]
MHRLFLAAAIAVAPTTVFAQAGRDNIDALIEQQAKANGVPASFVHAVVKRESNYNPRAKGGSALGLMQIKHATARSLGYTGDPAGLYDPETNLRYGVAYLAGAYRTAQGNVHQAYQYYNRGYYYAAKRQGVPTVVASTVAPVAASASALASLFIGRPPVEAAPAALAYAAAEPTPAEAVEVPLPPRRPGALAGGAQVQFASLTTDVQPAAASAPQTAADAATVEVPLPPRRPDGLGGAVQVAAATPAAFTELRLSPASPAAAAVPAEAAPAPSAEAVAVPLPPQRPSARLLALAAAASRPAAAPVLVQEAVALAPQ